MSWTLGPQRKGYDGYLLLEQQSGSTVYAFQPEQYPLTVLDNNGYIQPIDNDAILHDKVLGIKSGTLAFNSPVKLDRNWWSFPNLAFGPRTTGGITPFGGTILPSSADSAYSFGNIYFNTLDLTASFAMDGSNAMVRAAVNGMVMDPLNVGAQSNLSPPAASGTAGVGITSFSQGSFTNGAVSGLVTYDSVKSFRLSLNNQMTPQPSVSDPTNRLSPGCIPGMLIGQLTVTQSLRNTNAIPFSTGLYPFQIVLLSGDGTETWRLSFALSLDSEARVHYSRDYNMRTVAYTLFNTNSISPDWSFTSANS